jgi:pimeloyl-ACP methyl ester carboxylesterase
MVATLFIESADHTRIAYDVGGNGPALVLLHGGFVQDRRVWHEVGYVERLGREYKVIAVDFRGHGESDCPFAPEAYAPDRFIEDIKAVADACNARRFYIWGYSLGGAIGLQIACRVKETKGAILVGAGFGTLFPADIAVKVMSRVEAVEKAFAEGKFDEIELSPIERDFHSKVGASGIPFLKAIYRALHAYPPVEPAELLCPTLMVAGTENQLSASNLMQHEADIRAAGIRTQFLEGLDHAKELSEIDTVLPPCLSFLHGLSSR